MNQYVDQRGQSLATGAELGAGGEGTVLAGGADTVIKLYKVPPAAMKAEKLAAMLAWQPQRTVRVSAWPQATVHQGAGGQLAGVAMRRIPGVRLDFLTNTSERKALRPDLDWGFLVSVATNLAGAVEEIHADGIVIGDLNPAGILVDPQRGQVALIDMDSVQFADHRHRYTCDVGRPEYTAPELQRGGSLGGVWRARSSDHFSLAVILFEILFLGRHPFIAKPLAGKHGGEMPDAGTAIMTRGYAYGRDRQRYGWELPERWPTPELLPLYVQELFESAFGADPLKRPDATAWHRALLQILVPRLVRCPADRRHVHPVTVCPWCEYDRHGRYFFDPSLDAHINVGAVDPASLDAVLASLAEQVRGQLQLAEAVAQPTGPLAGAPVTAQAWAQCRWPTSLRVVGGLAAVTVVALLFGAVNTGRWCAVLTGVFAGGPYAHRWWQRRRTRLEVAQARQEIDQALAAWPPLHAAVLRDAQAWAIAHASIRSQHDEIARSSAEALASIRETAMRRHLEHHLLRCQPLAQLDASDIASLAQHGITSAADLSPGSLSDIRGIGLQKTGALMSWRRECERTFIFDPATPFIRSALQAQFTRQLADVQSAIVSLRQLTAALRRTEVTPAMQAQAAAIRPLVIRLAQAQANHQAVLSAVRSGAAG